ncbi:calcium-binding protein [Tropicimonas isoalkanivorans]|uniref:Ca2+-binding protein, RTX toxin-related n=1 Tax=Tropicimonas isoalkanivorans TaxID=441112 RepID=A0A1I1KB95_9RHOB|nr:calcium-binding protein [Tropicimonas isoalkanivorans]SFC58204.1 Ca2+-binding protein, RTX toxin-related [Tropicimonas isoalkanivorans]
MSYRTELQTYDSNLGKTVRNLEKLRDWVEDFNQAAGLAETVVSTVDTTGDVAEKIGEAIDDQLTVLKLAKQAGPLKAPSRAFETVLKAVRPAVEKIEEAMDKLNGTQDANRDGREEEGQFLDLLEKKLENVQENLDEISEKIGEKIDKLENTRAAAAGFLMALDKASGAEYRQLKLDVEDQFAARNKVVGPLATNFDKIVSKIDGVLDIIDTARIGPINVDFSAFSAAWEMIEDIASPLKIAAAAIKPIEPLLDAAGFVFDLVVAPVMDFLTKTLGIDDLLDSVADEIRKLMPEADFLDTLIDNIQDLLSEVRSFNTTLFKIADWLDDIDLRLYNGVVGDALVGPTAIGTELNEIVLGDRKADILDARGGDDEIHGRGGNDVLVAGEGDDLFYGGAGQDMVYFSGYFNQYEFAKDPTDGEIVVSHVKPLAGGINEGSTKLFGVERVVFRNIEFTIDELKRAKIGGSVLNGNDRDNLMFLNTSGISNADGLHVANGWGGNDRIFGSTANDLLNGGAGNDVLLPGLGDDVANGNAGLDYYQMLESGSNGGNRIDLTDGMAFTTEGTDTLSGIENLIIQGNGDHTLTGNGKANRIISANGDDVLAGKGGNDILMSGPGNDFLFAGAGLDRTFSGDQNDFIVATSRPVKGRGEAHDGGDGRDVLSYSLDYNTIAELRSSINGDPDLRNKIRDALDDLTDWGGSVRIDAATGKIEHIGASGERVAVDTAVGIEQYVGTDRADVLKGAVGPWDAPISLHGAGGNDRILTRGANSANGGDGDDLIKVTTPRSNGFGGVTFEGGGGTDTLDLTGIGEARWTFRLVGSISRSITATDVDYTGSLTSGGNNFFRANIDGFEKFILPDGAHRIVSEPEFSAVREFWLGAGDDYFTQDRGFATVHADAGNDEIVLGGGGSAGGKVLAGKGDDDILFDASDAESRVLAGNGNDYVRLERMEGVVVRGGAGFDTLVIDHVSSPASGTKAVVDLGLGTAYGTGLYGGYTQVKVDTKVDGFERVIATDGQDVLRGSTRGETLIGRGDNDLIDGRAGQDILYGGAGNDEIRGGGGDDRIHGGAGNDTLVGGRGTDTADYSYAVPDGLRGELTAANFGGITVRLDFGTVTGSFGFDTLSQIENVYGTDGDDSITGSRRANVLSGAKGNDVLVGRGGADIFLTGAGADRADGGGGDDRIVIGYGRTDALGRRGFDVLDLGSAGGELQVNFATGRYSGEFYHAKTVWIDTGTNEAREYRGVLLTPRDVKQANPVFSDGVDDVSRILPGPGDAAADSFMIKEVNSTLNARGTFSGIEKIEGGAATVRLTLSKGLDRYDGRDSPEDLLDFSTRSGKVVYNLDTGSTNLGIATGDKLLGIDGILGGVGVDRLTGNDSANVLSGNRGDDRLAGKGGADRLFGGDGRDVVLGNDGKDLLIGGEGRDVVRGGDGRDTLRGAGGNDVLDGGRGADRFLFDRGDGRDRIVDFTPDVDHMVIRSGASRYSDLEISKAAGGDTLITFANVTVRLEDVAPNELDRGDFIF